MLILFVAITVLLVVPKLLFDAFDRGRHPMWGVTPGAGRVRGQGAYRQVREPTYVARRAPGLVRLAAFVSFVFAQLAFPWALGAVVVAAGGFARLSEPSAGPPFALLLFCGVLTGSGVMVGARLLGLGAALLARQTPRALAHLGGVVRWAVAHHLSIFGGLVLGDVRYAEIWMVAIAYAGVSIAVLSLGRWGGAALEDLDMADEA